MKWWQPDCWPGWVRSLAEVGHETWRLNSRIGVSQLAASFSYYAFFSIFPFLALLLWVGALFFQPDEVVHALRDYFPMGGEVSQLVWEGVRSLEAAHGTLNLAFVLVFLWASLRFFQMLVHGVSMAWSEEQLPWWQLPLKNLLMVLTVASALVLGVLAPLLLQIARNAAVAMQEHLNLHFPDFNLEGVLPVVDLTRLLLASVVLFYALAVLFMLAPGRRVFFRSIWLQALTVALLLQGLQIVFVNYLPMFLRYNAIYGTMGGVMFLLLWIYLTGFLILLGGCWCAAAAHCREAKHRVPVQPLPPAT
jgi:YihY family inner membrane protein